jgi:transcriptional regulator with XRE-family HTH domain
MSEHNYSVGPVMKAARKFKNFNQADVAQAIGCSQSALSKMEHNLLIPSAPQWFLFSRFTSIPPETLETGIIDRHSIVRFNNDQVSLGFKIPKKYRHFRSEKVREIYPFLIFLEKKMTPPLNKEFMLSTRLEREFFLDFDNLINFQLFVDTVDYFIKIGKSDSSDIKGIVNFGQDDIYWNHYGVEWKKLENISAVLNWYALEQTFFQTDFQLKVEIHSGKTIVSYFPEYHLKQISTTITPDVVEFLNHYRVATLENLINKVLGAKIKVELMPGVHSSPLGARLEVKDAA